MKYRFQLGFLMLMIISLLACPCDASIVPNLRHLMDQLNQQYKNQLIPKHKPALAVLPLNSNPELAKRRVGFALSELLTHQFFQSGEYTIVERTEILKVLEEQKLQQTGAIAPEKAVQVGKLIGATVLALGSVEKISSQYLVNLRLVQVDRGVVVATAFAELPAREFEESAKPYMMLVPVEQSLGIYGIYNRHLRSKSISPIDAVNVYGSPVSVKPEPFDLILWGGGIRYQPTQHIITDISFMVPEPDTIVGTQSFGSYSYPIDIDSGIVWRALIGRKGHINKKFYYQLSGGAISYHFSVSMTSTGQSKILPTIQVSLEFRPQDRIGLSLAGNCDLGTFKYKSTDIPGEPIIFELNRFSWEPTISIYF